MIAVARSDHHMAPAAYLRLRLIMMKSSVVSLLLF